MPKASGTETTTVPCEYLAWDSDFFGARIARVSGAGGLNASSFIQIDQWCEHQRIDCLYLFTNATDVETMILAECRGFRLMDVRVTFQHRAPGGGDRKGPKSPGVIRPARESDIATLSDIAASSHRNTRFYADQHFSRARCDAFYREWIEKSCRGWADHVLAVELNGTACGYMTCHLDGDGSGRVGLIALAEGARGRGLAHLLVSHALDWFAERHVERVTWATQANSADAQRLCGRCGFELVAVGMWHHRWYGGEQ
jgi:dTDP-4-amino-4,6-dideoxy-D-galactose acyltransferase